MTPYGLVPAWPRYAPPYALTPAWGRYGPTYPLLGTIGQAKAPPPPAVMNDSVADHVTATWKEAFPDATLLPVIGKPSNNHGVMTLTHTMGGRPMTIDGLASRSPLANNALYSCEVTGGKYLNLYEIMLPDVPGQGGSPSSCQRYVRSASALGITIAGLHYHWPGANMDGRFPLALHTMAIGMDPVEFSRRTIASIRAAMGMPPKTGYLL